MKSIFLFVPFCFYLSLSRLMLATADDETTDAACVRDIKGRFPEYSTRLPDSVIRHVCRMARVWVEEAAAGQAAGVSNPELSSEQLDYFYSVTRCRGLQCLCDQWDECREYYANNRPIYWLNLTDISAHIRTGQFEGTLVGHFEGAIILDHPRKRQVGFNGGSILAKYGKATRKEIRALSEEERSRFFGALNTLKTEKIGKLSKYDILITYHTPEYAPEAHYGAAFLLYHRELLKNIEIALRMVDPTVSVPYWDSTLDSPLPNPADSVLWTEELLGNGDGEVVTGPFANWTTLEDVKVREFSPRRKIVRSVGKFRRNILFDETDLARIMRRREFRDLVYCVDPFFELVHGLNHVFVGGHMVEVRVSPNDPTFFLVHGWVDLVWEQWRQSRQTVLQRENDFVFENETCNNYSLPDAPMRPFLGKVKDGLSNKYTNDFYSYQSRPTCSIDNRSCRQSPYLYCDVDRARCLSKVRIYGNCSGFEGTDICYKGTCKNGTCVDPQNLADVSTPTVASESTTTSPIQVGSNTTSSSFPNTEIGVTTDVTIAETELETTRNHSETTIPSSETSIHTNATEGSSNSSTRTTKYVVSLEQSTTALLELPEGEITGNASQQGTSATAVSNATTTTTTTRRLTTAVILGLPETSSTESPNTSIQPLPTSSTKIHDQQGIVAATSPEPVTNSNKSEDTGNKTLSNQSLSLVIITRVNGSATENTTASKAGPTSVKRS